MAINLRNAAVKSLGTGHPSSFYSTSFKDDKNPVFQGLEQELSQFKSLITSRHEKARKNIVKVIETNSRASNTLFDLWNKYEKLLPELAFEEKILEIGDFLSSIGEYQLALWQCYSRYLRRLGDIEVEEITEENDFVKAFFSNGFDAENAGFTFRALMGKAICTYQMLQTHDPMFQNKETLDRCQNLLNFLRLVMQVVLRKERLCWLVYNGTVYMYTVCRCLMSRGYSRMVLEYLLWACCCMEVCVPLLTVKYLPWRATLYASVCQCYYDGKSGAEAEAFARRGLSKINELSQLECLSSGPQSPRIEMAFREATNKMAVMIFKRSVFETRRRPKGILRPKTRVNLKDAMQSPWPRTQSERLLMDMMEGSAAQMLCLLEALSDSNRRIFQHGPGASDNESELLDVYSELLFAGQELVAGGGGNTPSNGRLHNNSMPGLHGIVTEEADLMTLAVRGADGVTTRSVVRLVKWAFCYEQWDCFDAIVHHLLAFLKNLSEEGEAAFIPDELVLQLLVAMKAVQHSKRGRRVQMAVGTFGTEAQSGATGASGGGGAGGLAHTGATSSIASSTRRKSEVGSAVTAGTMAHSASVMPAGAGGLESSTAQTMVGAEGAERLAGEAGATLLSDRGPKQDELLHFADVLLCIIDGPLPAEAYDLDIVNDALIFLWHKVKPVFQKYQTGSIDNARYLQRMENVNKWVFILDVVHRGLGWTGVSTVDPSLSAEVVLRLALVLESSALVEDARQSKSNPSQASEPGAASQARMAQPSQQQQHQSQPGPQESSATLAQKSTLAGSKSTLHTARESQAPPQSDSGGAAAAAAAAAAVASEALTMTILRQPAKAQLALAKEILALGLRNISVARETVALADGRGIADIVWAKDLNPALFDPLANLEEEEEEEAAGRPSSFSKLSRGSSSAVWSTVKDLQIELLMMYHRICLKLVDLEEKERPMKKASNPKAPVAPKAFDILLQECCKNHVSKAMLLMQRALMSGAGDPPDEGGRSVEKLLKEAEDLLNKAMAEERLLFSNNPTLDSNSDPLVTTTTTLATATAITGATGGSSRAVPPAPILLRRTDTQMTFRPAPWAPPAGEKVAWYRLYARPVIGSNVKVRLNDYNIAGTAEDVPAFNCQLSAHGLVPDEKYMFAVAAFSADGRLIGGAVGDSTRPILASHPMSILAAWACLCQTAYQAGAYEVAKRASQLLWNHFVAIPPPPERAVVRSEQKDFRLTYHRLNRAVVKLASPVLLRQFITSLFISTDIATIEKRLFCDSLSDRGPLFGSQVSRLRECEKMLVGIDLAGWLNETSLGLQCVINAYGLLAPMVHYKMQTVPVVQILQRCLAVLMEVPSQTVQKRGSHSSESIYHMAACITYYVARTLRTWRDVSLANHVSECGRKLLSIDSGEATAKKGAAAANDEDQIGEHVVETFTLEMLKKKKSRRAQKDDADGFAPEELKAIEAYLLSLSKQVISSYMFDPKYWEQGQGTGDHELTGNEDPCFLYAYIAFLPSSIAYKEVAKFRRRARYLEFFVQVLGRALSEGNVESAIEWAKETLDWLEKRNESLLGTRFNKQPAAITIQVDESKKQDNMSKDREDGSTVTKAKVSSRGKPKKSKYKALRSNPNLTDAQRQAQEEAEMQALEVLSLYLPDLVRKTIRKRRYRAVSADELPWKSNLHLIQGLCHFGLFTQKLELRSRLFESNQKIFQTAYLDQEWFNLDCSGTLLFLWQSVPEGDAPAAGGKTTHRRESRAAAKRASQVAVDRRRESALEAAARSAITYGPRMAPPDGETDALGIETPRTYRSDMKDPKKKSPEDVQLVSPQMIRDALDKAFKHLKRAAVLAHRGRHWTLLQNAGGALWNSVHTALLHLNCEPDLVPVEALRQMLWEPMYITADCLIDMLLMYRDAQEALNAKAKGPKSSKTEAWIGGPEAEKGGASLRFDAMLDETNSLDMRWLRRFQLRTLEILFHQEKFERLVHLALRFNAVTNNRYAEQSFPLVVQAQRRLIERIDANEGAPPPQPHYILAMANSGQRAIAAKDYLCLQLQTVVDHKRLRELNAGALVDSKSSNFYDDGKSARQNVCVPLDVACSLEEFRKALQDTSYMSRALQHSRQLMTLYLAGQQQGNSAISKPAAHVNFVPTTAHPQPSAPPDRSKEEFRHDDDVKSTALPRSQLNVVMTSYEKTIELLLSRGQSSLAAQAMRELGSLHYHANDRKKAFHYWSECLDLILGVKDALHKWRQVAAKSAAAEDTGSDDHKVPNALLKKCGLWGCMLGATVAANIAQYIVTADLGLKIECCFLAGCMFKALLRSTLPHPLSDRNYALYDIGEGCEVSALIPGVSLLSDKFRMDGRAMEAALRYIVEELFRAGHNLFVLPLLTIYLWLVTQLCRDVGRSVQGRILRLRVLTNLGLFHEASLTLIQLLWGERLPQAFDSNFRQVESRPPECTFDTSKPLLAEGNLKLIDRLLTKRLTATLAATYGPHLTCRLSVAHANLLMSIAQSVQALPVYPKVNLQQINMQVSNIGTRTSKKRRGSIAQRLAAAEDLDTRSIITHVNNELQGDRLTEEMVKGLLLKTSTEMLQSISEAMLEASAVEDSECSSLAPAELELVLECLLGLAKVARIRQHARTGARFAQRAMRLLTTSRHLQAEPPPPSKITQVAGPGGKLRGRVPGVNHKLELENFVSRGRLDIRLWITCRLELVECLLAEVRGMGEVSCQEKSVYPDVPDLRVACLEGIAEAEGCGDVELRAQFLLQLGRAELMGGKTTEQVRLVFEEMAQCLRECPRLSTGGQALQVIAALQLEDLRLMTADRSEAELDSALHNYLALHDELLRQMEGFGEVVETHVNRRYRSTLVSPMANLYQPLLPFLIHAKLRLANCLSRKAAFRQHTGYKAFLERSGDGAEKPKWDHSEELADWVEALGVTMTAIEMSQAAVARSASIEAELLLILGKIQRHLMQHGLLSSRVVAKSFIEGLRIVFKNSHDLGLIRQFYFELALTYMTGSGMVTPTEAGSIMATQEIAVDGLTATKPAKPPKKKWTSKKERTATKMMEETDLQREKRAAWLAVRCACAVARAQQALVALHGESGHELTAAQRAALPDFLCYDLVASNVLGNRKQVFRNEIEEELSSMPEAQLPPESEHYEDQVQRVSAATEGMTWTSVIGYYSLLQQLCVNRGVELDSSCAKEEEEPSIELNFENITVPDAHRMFGHRHLNRTPLFDAPWSQRLGVLHQFFTNAWSVYKNKCCAVYPPDAVQLETTPFDLAAVTEELSGVFYVSYRQQWLPPPPPPPPPPAPSTARTPVGPQIVAPPQPQPPVETADAEGSTGVQPPPRIPGTSDNAFKPPEGPLMATNESDIVIQFYRPSLDPVIIRPENTSIVLLFASTKKVERTASWTGAINTGLRVVSLPQLLHLFTRLRLLAQHTDLLSTQERKRKPEEKPAAKGKEKPGSRGKAQPAKPRVDPAIELATRSCLDEILTLLGAETERKFGLESVLSDAAELEKIPESKRPLEIPFEINKDFLKQLRLLFDPVHGAQIKTGKVQVFISAFFAQKSPEE